MECSWRAKKNGGGPAQFRPEELRRLRSAHAIGEGGERVPAVGDRLGFLFSSKGVPRTSQIVFQPNELAYGKSSTGRRRRRAGSAGERLDVATGRWTEGKP